MANEEEKDLRNLSTKQALYKEVIIEEDWMRLLDKHKLRYEIWMILKLDNELNVTEISHLVKQSKSTVSRVLIGMEKDGLVKSRRGKTTKKEGEKIPAKIYKLNEEYRDKNEFELNRLDLPPESHDLRKFYMVQIKNYQNAIYTYHKLLDLLTPLLKIVENSLDDIDQAKYIYERYLSDESEPLFNLLYFDYNHYKEFLDIRLEYQLKLIKLAQQQNINTNNTFVYFDASIPLKAIFELKKEKILKNK
ncbi:MAG: winged helix-turn-helix domain-containing protein [Promethearchaeota archaeon]